jgi:3-hydroxybutyrate dehydrogenase
VKNVMLKEAVDGEFTTVEDVVNMVAFLAGFESAALTGQSVIVSAMAGPCTERPRMRSDL